MTVSYSLDVSKARFCGFSKLLGRWKGSIYKILWQEFLVFCLIYTLISIVYRNLLSEDQKIIFEKVVLFVETFTDAIPLTFVLGFYVSLVVGRWWGQYATIPWPDRLCFMIATHVQGSCERSRMIRRTMGRYVILAMALTFQAVSTAVKKRFPTTNHLVSAGIMTKGEQSVLEKISFVYGKWWLPLHWFGALAARARREEKIKDSIALNSLLQEMLEYRNSCAIMFGYDWISVPLVYTQVVTIATYLYALSLLIGKQYLDPGKGYSKHELDLYIPFFTLLQFFFFIGWLKVSEQILNPYGEDDDDFELNWCLDRTVNLVYLTVDDLQMKHPKVVKDFFWGNSEPILPHTKHSAKILFHPQLGSASSLNVEDIEYLPMEALFEQDDDGNSYRGGSMKKTEARPSLIRRMLSTSFGKSRKRRLTQRSTKSTTQAFDNLAFDLEQGRSTSRYQKSDVLNNSFESIKGNQNTISFRPNSIEQLSTSDSDGKLVRHSYPLHSNSTDVGKSGSHSVGRTVSAPVQRMHTFPEDEESDFYAKEDDSDSALPSIPEEARRPSVDGTLVQLQNVHQLVQRASRALGELNRSISIDNQIKETISSHNEIEPKPNEKDSVGDQMEDKHCSEQLDEATNIDVDIKNTFAEAVEVDTKRNIPEKCITEIAQ